MKPQIVVCEDGFKFQIVSPAEALKIFTENTTEVFVLDDNNYEYLVKDVSEFKVNHRYAIEYNAR